MLNKLLLNNHIISNKKKIEQARVQTINKLVQKIRKLTLLSQKHVDKARIESNLKRVLLILGCVKKLKPAEIIRSVLTLHKKPTAVVTNGQAKPQDVAVALLASNKIIDDLANALRTNLHLNDRNPGWREEIMEPSKKKKKPNSKSGNSSKNTSARSKLSWKEEHIELDRCENLRTDDTEIETEDCKDESMDNIVEIPTESTMSIVKSQEEEDYEYESNNNSTEVLTPVEFPKKNISTIDSFFFTITGENYMSSVVFKRKQPEAPNDGLVRRERRQRSKHDGHKKSLNSKRRGDDKHGYSWWKEKPIQMHDNRRSVTGKNKNKADIIEFQGHKIKIDDEPTGKSKKRAPEQNDDNLHPSWAAKQKLKPSITLFKGKKIKFED